MGCMHVREKEVMIEQAQAQAKEHLLMRNLTRRGALGRERKRGRDIVQRGSELAAGGNQAALGGLQRLDRGVGCGDGGIHLGERDLVRKGLRGPQLADLSPQFGQKYSRTYANQHELYSSEPTRHGTATRHCDTALVKIWRKRSKEKGGVRSEAS